MRVTFEPAARDDLDSPRAALAMIDRIERKAIQLATPGLAQMGRPGIVEGTRELLEWPYIIVYRMDDRQEIVILAVVHGARDREDLR